MLLILGDKVILHSFMKDSLLMVTFSEFDYGGRWSGSLRVSTGAVYVRITRTVILVSKLGCYSQGGKESPVSNCAIFLAILTKNHPMHSNVENSGRFQDNSLLKEMEV